MRLPVGIDDFKKLIKGQYNFADKSLFVKDIIDDGAEVIVITRPRRFGKTLNLSMLYYFLQCNEVQNSNLFEGLAISKDLEFCKKHQQQYPVIFISFKEIKQPTYEESYGDIVELIRQLYEKHQYLLKDNILSEGEKAIFNALINKKADLSNIKTAIQQLSQYMKRRFDKSPIILIDEYDTPIQAAYLEGYYKEMIGLMRSILGHALKGNKDLYKAIVTGITRVAQESLFSGVNNLKVYSLLQEKYGQYFGFVEEEVSQLIKTTDKKVSIAAIKEWYNGYQVGSYVLYNPWSIINCLDENGELKAYWLNTSSHELIARLLMKAEPIVKQQFEELLQGKSIEQPISENLVFTEIETREDALWSLLFYAGYLKVLSKELLGYQLMAKMAIPNKEVGFAYDRIVDGWFREVRDFRSYQNFTQSLANGDMERFKAYLSSYIIQSGSYFDFNTNTPEQIFHVFILGLVVGLRDSYIIQSNSESGLGRFDVAFIPKPVLDLNKQAVQEQVPKNGILLEFKTAATPELLLSKAQEALTQIKDKQYVQIFEQHNIKSVLAIGMAFCGRQMELVYENIKI